MNADSRESPGVEIIGLPPQITQGPVLSEMETPYVKPQPISLAVYPSSVVGVGVVSSIARVRLAPSSRFAAEELAGGGLSGGRLPAVGSRLPSVVRQNVGTTMTTTSASIAWTTSTSTTASTQLTNTLAPPMTASQSSTDADLIIGLSVAAACIFIMPCIWCMCRWVRIAKSQWAGMRTRSFLQVVPDGVDDDTAAKVLHIKDRMYMPQSRDANELGKEAEASDKNALRAAFGILPESDLVNDDEMDDHSKSLQDTLDDVESNLPTPWPPRPDSVEIGIARPCTNELHHLRVEDVSEAPSPSLYTPSHSRPRSPILDRDETARAMERSASQTSSKRSNAWETNDIVQTMERTATQSSVVIDIQRSTAWETNEPAQTMQPTVTQSSVVIDLQRSSSYRSTGSPVEW